MRFSLCVVFHDVPVVILGFCFCVADPLLHVVVRHSGPLRYPVVLGRQEEAHVRPLLQQKV